MASRWYAVEALDEALERTRWLLFKDFKLSLWLKLALVVYLIGGGSFNGNFNVPGGENGMQGPTAPNLKLIIAVLAVVLAFVLFFMFLKDVCEFIFIETAETKKIELWKGFKRNLENGLNLFLFELVVIAVVIIVAVAAFLGFRSLLAGASGLGPKLAIAVVGLAAAISIVLAIAIVGSLTTAFAIVIMHKERKGLVNAWKKLLTLVEKNTRQFVVYIIIELLLAFVAAMVVFAISLVIALIAIAIIIIPAIIAAVIAIALGLESNMLWLLLVPAIAFIIAYFMVVGYFSVLITLPVPVFFRYYSMIFLQKVDPKLAILKPEKDAAKTQSKKTGKKDGEKKKAGKRLRVY